MVRVRSERREEAIRHLVGTGSQMDHQHARRFLEYASQNRISLDGLWSRLDRTGRIESTVLAVPNPGRTAMLFATRTVSRDQALAVGELIDFTCRELAGFEVDLAQTLLDPSETLDQEAFTTGGFIPLATLSYLERSNRRNRGPSPQRTNWPAGAVPMTYREDLRDELLEVLNASYEHTLDCPGLRGYRRTEDILEGHKSSGHFTPELWTLLWLEGRPAGALLLNPAADHQSVELVYLGLAPAARGRGLGTALLHHGFGLLADRSERTIHLAVDEANVRALRLYLREGFVAVLRRNAMIRPVRTISVDSRT
jgi:mycothiol synthase